MKTILATAAVVAVCITPGDRRVDVERPHGHRAAGVRQRQALRRRLRARDARSSRGQGESTRVRSGTDGSYRVLLSPGTYRVSPYPRIGIVAPRVRPNLVHVRANHVDELDFTVTLGLYQAP